MHQTRKEIVRPIDGPGNNSLRGQKYYSNPRTAVGSWMDVWDEKGQYRRGFTDPRFLTETENAQYSGIGKVPGKFGAGLIDEEISSPAPKNRSVLSGSARVITKDAWTTNTQVMAHHEWKEQVSFQHDNGSYKRHK
jgi:hypothetical protein